MVLTKDDAVKKYIVNSSELVAVLVDETSDTLLRARNLEELGYRVIILKTMTENIPLFASFGKVLVLRFEFYFGKVIY